MSQTPYISNNPLLTAFVHPRLRVLRHLLLIIIMIAIFKTDKKEYSGNADIYIGLGVLLFFLGFIYINMYLLVPRLLFNNRYLGYCLAVIGLVIISFFLLIVTDHLVLQRYRVLPRKETGDGLWKGMFAYTFLFGIVMSAATAVKLFQRWIIDSRRMSEMEKRRLQSELDQLKSQINPHFLFNMLNNANVLTYTDPMKASEVLVKLSDLLRYQIYDSARDKVFLTSDIHFLADLLDLEKIRRDHFEYMISREGSISHVMIPPFLFVTFVENAIKHNLDAQKASYVQLFFSVHNQTLSFKCINSKPAVRAVHQERGGFGLLNVKRRLELLYPGRIKWISTRMTKPIRLN